MVAKKKVVKARKQAIAKRPPPSRARSIVAPTRPPRMSKAVEAAPAVKRGLLGQLGSLAGSALGGLFGGKTGSALGSGILGQVGDWVGNITGMGAYKIKQNSLTGDGGPPVFSGADETVLTHREFLTDVVGSIGFTITAYDINVALQSTFAWLGPIAANWEQYTVHGMVFEFKSTSGNAVSSTNAALGVVIASTVYDVYNPAFTNKQQMEAYEYTTSCAASGNMIHGVECAPGNTPVTTLFTRSATGLPVGADQRFYDLGVFYLATQGMQAANTVGELWVSYHVSLKKPRLPAPFGANLPAYHAVGTGTSFTSGPPTLTGSYVVRSGSTLGLTIAPVSTTFSFGLTMPNLGRYIVTIIDSATAAWNASVNNTGSIGITANLSFSQIIGPGLVAAGSSVLTTASQPGVLVVVVDVNVAGTGAANVLNFAVSTLTTSSTTTFTQDVFVTQVSSGLTSPARVTVNHIEQQIESLRKIIEDSQLDAKLILEAEDGTMTLVEDNTEYVTKKNRENSDRFARVQPLSV